MNSFFEHINRYHPLTEKAKEALERELNRVELPKNALLVQEHKVCNHLYFLETGCLRGFYNLDGKEVTYWFGFENSFVTSFYSFISRKPSFENIQLMEDSTLWSVSYQTLQNLYDQYVDMERLGRIVHEKYYIMLEERFVANHFKDAKERYENLLESSPHILQRAPLGYIASYLGISQETLSRIRGKI
jgi:CRP-like cAMP-binding protein